MKKHIFIIVLSLFLGISTMGQDSRTGKLTKICIDPGHGGDKPGAQGSRCLEKDINLDVSLKLGKLIEDYLKDVEVIYTRKTDVDVNLIQRSNIANRNKADLFISIHCNSATNKAAHGSETFAMGLTKSKENLEVARKENADILKEADHEVNYGGFNPNSPEASIFFSLYQNAYMDQSLRFADKIQKEMTRNTGLFNRGVKQAGFLVLFKIAMPGVLTEIGFISNREEETYLMSEKGKDEVAASLFRAICQYKIDKEGKSFEIPSIEALTGKNKKEIKPLTQEIAKQETPKSEEGKKTEPNTVTGIEYRVQFFTSPNNIDNKDGRFRNLENIWKYMDNNLWKYTSGCFSNYQDAYAHQKDVRSKGFGDAFVVSFENNKRIPLNQAREKERL